MEEIKEQNTNQETLATQDANVPVVKPDAFENLGDFDTDQDILLDVSHVGMKFRIPSERIDNLKEFCIKLVKGQLHYTSFVALKDVTFQVRRGESIGLIGRNGAGKSTLLKIISGIIEPTAGYVKTRGNIVPLLKLGAGFDYNATGKENVFLNGAMLGFSRREMNKKYDSIVEFAELEKFMNVPLKNYSQGMITRLGFAIAVDVNPDVLLIDEILAVGDAVFQKKCAEKIDELRKNGTTFIVVSHSTSQILRLCQNAIYLKDGNVVQYGTAKEVVEAYQKDCALAEQAQKKQ